MMARQVECPLRLQSGQLATAAARTDSRDLESRLSTCKHEPLIYTKVFE